MSVLPRSVASAHGTLAAVKRHHPNSEPRITTAARDLAAANLAAYVVRVVAKAPPLTDAQRDSIAALLRPVAGGVRDAS